MAPRKEKAEKVGSNEASDMVLNYLRKQNRPYSATDVSANLHNKVTKANAAKLLKEMHDRKEIEGRSAGKQTVYHVIQDPKEAATPQELAEMDIKLLALKHRTVAVQDEIKTYKAHLATLNATMSTADVRARVEAFEAEAADIIKCLDGYRSGVLQPMTAAERNSVENQAKRWSWLERERCKVAKDMWLGILDVLPEDLNAEELREGLGLDG